MAIYIKNLVVYVDSSIAEKFLDELDELLHKYDGGRGVYTYTVDDVDD